MYRPGQHKMVCERCGGVYLDTEMREEWNGAWVCTRGCWEPRHPQDFVEGVEDNQTVPVSRPDVPQTMGATTLNGAVAKDSMTAVLTSASGVSEDDPIGITMDNEIVFWTFVDEISGSTVTLGEFIPFASASGNTVYLPSLNSESWTS